MNTVKNILLPTDGSDCSLKAAAFAGDLARLVNARITVLLVQDEASIIASAWNTADDNNNEGPTAAARSSLEHTAMENEMAATKSTVGDVPGGIDLVHLWGQPANEICRYAAENAIDLIIMGSHGRSGFREILLGSVSHTVVNKAKCAVTIVR